MANFQDTYPTTASGGSGEQSMSRAGNGLAVAGMVCGIVGVILFNIVLGPLAIIFGGVGLSRARNGAGHRNMAVAGIVLGIIDVVLFGILIAVASNHGGSVYFHAG